MDMKNCVLIATLCLLCSCNGRFNDIQEEGVSYQILPGSNDFIKIINGNGAPEIQLLDENFNLKLSETINGGYPIAISNCKADDIEIAHIMSKSDTASFLAWARHHKDNPVRIGNYHIKYTFKINNGFFKETEYQIDNFSICRDNFTVNFSFKNKVLANVPIPSLQIQADGFTYINFDEGVIREFNVQNKELIILFLNDIGNPNGYRATFTGKL